MKIVDWQMIIFVGVSITHDLWIYWGLPRIYYFEVKQYELAKLDKELSKKRIA